VPVFLGLHLLVTDPATSPRTLTGRVVFGGLYGVGVFGTYLILGWLGAPRVYEKLLCLPLLNLFVRKIDRIGEALSIPSPLPEWSAKQANMAGMVLWILCFATMLATGALRLH